MMVVGYNNSMRNHHKKYRRNAICPSKDIPLWISRLKRYRKIVYASGKPSVVFALENTMTGKVYFGKRSCDANNNDMIDLWIAEKNLGYNGAIIEDIKQYGHGVFRWLDGRTERYPKDAIWIHNK